MVSEGPSEGSGRKSKAAGIDDLRRICNLEISQGQASISKWERAPDRC